MFDVSLHKHDISHTTIMQLIVSECEKETLLILPFMRLHMQVMSLNNNRLTDLSDMSLSLNRCPRLAMLSLLRNPFCPDCCSAKFVNKTRVLVCSGKLDTDTAKPCRLAGFLTKDKPL